MSVMKKQIEAILARQDRKQEQLAAVLAAADGKTAT